jgi:hypothetical protein
MDTLYCLKAAWDELNERGIDPTLEQVLETALRIRKETS